MGKELIKITLTEFMNYVNKSGSSKATVVSTAKSRRKEEYSQYKDYWLPLRKKIKEIHQKQYPIDDLLQILNEISEKKVENYKMAICGYKKFLGKGKVEWCNPPRKAWIIGNIKIELNPELGIKLNNKLFYIKMMLSAKDNIDKKHADMILTLMENELRDKVEEDAIFAVLDVRKGKLFKHLNYDKKLYSLLKAETRSFETLWNEL